MTLAAGTRLGPYEIASRLGAGAMGEVYRARDPRLGREVAIKVLPAEVAQDPDRLRRFEQEARAASAIHHPNLLTVFDVGSHERTAYLVTELLSGESLREPIRRGPMTTKNALEIAIQIAHGLAAAHEKGIIHRDLKPENLFVTNDGVAKILDFGLAKIEVRNPPNASLADASTALETSAGTVLGTVGYMAPEQVRGERADARSDLFSLGVILYEMLAGRRPFAGATAPEVMSAVLRDEPPPIAVSGTSDGRLESIVRRCLEKRPEHRFQSSRDLAVALGMLSSDPSPSSLAVAAARRRGPHWRRAAGRVLGLMTVGGALLFFYTRLLTERRPVAPAPIRSLAVLPFTNLSEDRAQEYFSDGFTDELTTTLARLSALKVIARTSASSYKGTEKRASQIGRELGVEGLVSGSVLRYGDHVRITAQLVSADSEINLWAESYERGQGDMLALQAEVARAIARAVAVRLSPEESARLAAPGTVDPRALDAYLRGRALWNQRTEAAVREGLDHFESASRIAPGFALAFAGVADSSIILGVYGFEPPLRAFPAAKIAAQHAIELDPTAGEPHASLGDIHFHYDWDWEASNREHRTAIELSPGFATAYHWRAEPLLIAGRFGEALEALRRARSLDPLSMTIRASLAQTLSLTGDREGAIAELREAVTLDPQFPRTRGELARQLLWAGRGEEALAEARRLVEANPDDIPAQATLGLCLGTTGRSAEARGILGKLDHESGRRFVSSLDRARITAGLRDRTATLHYLEDAVVAREGSLPFLPLSPEFDFLRGDPRYAAVLKRIGVAETVRGPFRAVGPRRTKDRPPSDTHAP